MAKSCSSCCSLKSSVIICAAFTLVLTSMYFATLLFPAIIHGATDRIVLELGVHTSMTISSNVVTAFLLYGAGKENKSFILPWLLHEIIYLVLAFFVFFVKSVIFDLELDIMIYIMRTTCGVVAWILTVIYFKKLPDVVPCHSYGYNYILPIQEAVRGEKSTSTERNEYKTMPPKKPAKSQYDYATST